MLIGAHCFFDLAVTLKMCNVCAKVHIFFRLKETYWQKLTIDGW